MTPDEYADVLIRIIRLRHCDQRTAQAAELRLMVAGEHEAAHRVRVARMVAWYLREAA